MPLLSVALSDPFHRPETRRWVESCWTMAKKTWWICCDRPIDCRSRHDIRQRTAFELHRRRESDITDASGKKELIKSGGFGHKTLGDQSETRYIVFGTRHFEVVNAQAVYESRAWRNGAVDWELQALEAGLSISQRVSTLSTAAWWHLVLWNTIIESRDDSSRYCAYRMLPWSKTCPLSLCVFIAVPDDFRITL